MLPARDDLQLALGSLGGRDSPQRQHARVLLPAEPGDDQLAAHGALHGDIDPGGRVHVGHKHDVLAKRPCGQARLDLHPQQAAAPRVLLRSDLVGGQGLAGDLEVSGPGRVGKLVAGDLQRPGPVSVEAHLPGCRLAGRDPGEDQLRGHDPHGRRHPPRHGERHLRPLGVIGCQGFTLAELPRVPLDRPLEGHRGRAARRNLAPLGQLGVADAGAAAARALAPAEDQRPIAAVGQHELVPPGAVGFHLAEVMIRLLEHELGPRRGRRCPAAGRSGVAALGNVAPRTSAEPDDPRRQRPGRRDCPEYRK